MIILDEDSNLAWHSGKEMVLHNFMPDKPKYYENEKIYGARSHLSLFHWAALLYDREPNSVQELCDLVLNEVPLPVKIYPGLPKSVDNDNGDYAIGRLEALVAVYNVLQKNSDTQKNYALFEATALCPRSINGYTISITIAQDHLEHLFLKEYSGNGSVTQAEIPGVVKEASDLMKSRGYVRSRFGRRIRNATDPLASLLSTSIQDYLCLITYDLHRLIKPWGCSAALLHDGVIYIDAGPISLERKEALIGAIPDIIDDHGDLHFKLDQTGISIKEKGVELCTKTLS